MILCIRKKIAGAFSCDICGKRFAKEGNLLKHKMSCGKEDLGT